MFGQVPEELRLKAPGERQPLHWSAQQPQPNDDSKSATVAVLLSLVLPGAGEWYAGNFETGKYFLLADGALWLSYGAFQLRGDWLREDARSFAQRHAGADFSGKDNEFDVNIGNFLSMDEFNQARLRAREYDAMYLSADFNWRWESNAKRVQFRELRIASDEMYENASFVVGALVINRIISAFSAGRAAARSGSQETYKGMWQMGAGVQGGVQDAHGLEIRFSKEF
ncbi:MAG: hypothetical protein L0287_25855 [Anaerolineae bacterium]|nr:hypothetical protein [Anaerolineae bacterium]MCI0706482.1 hypothetical protein [Ignavibacteriota bacterium]